MYLRSRGHACTPQIEDIRASWQAAKEHVISEAASAIASRPVVDEDTSKHGGRSGFDPSDIEHTSVWLLRDFWEAESHQFWLDATMLRTVACCQISGFDSWWRRLAHTEVRNLLLGGVDPEFLIKRLFAYSRSEFAIQLMPQYFENALRVVQLPSEDGDLPWTSSRKQQAASQGWGYRQCDNVAYAGALAFCVLRLKAIPAAETSLVASAIDCLQHCQLADGSWPRWADDPTGSIEATAICLLGLTMAKPPSAARMTLPAIAWLLAQQHRAGYWKEPSCPDAAYLTVLVLDAMAAAAGETANLTFSSCS